MSDWRLLHRQCETLRNYSRSEDILKEALRAAPSPTEEKEILGLLMQCYVQQSRHGLAYECARTYQSSLGIRHLSWKAGLATVYVTGAILLLGPFRWAAAFAKSVAWFIRPSREGLQPTWEELVALLHAGYWTNIRRCHSYCLLLARQASNEEQAMTALGYLAYTAAYVGHSVLGLAMLRYILKQAKKKGLRNVQTQLFAHRIIACQMAARPAEAVRCARDFQRAFPDASPFHRLLVYANLITIYSSELDLRRANRAIDRCFSFTFALNESRHHIQIYGYKAMLRALVSDTERAEEFSTKAAAAAQASNDPLDYLIHHRITALLYLTLGNGAKSQEHVDKARHYCGVYGNPAWYSHELLLLDTILALHRSAGRLERAWARARFVLGSLTLFNWNLTLKTFRVLPNLLFDRKPAYWSKKNLASFLAVQARTSTKASDYQLLSVISGRLAEVVLHDEAVEDTRHFSKDKLVHQVQNAFGSKEVSVSDSVDGLLEQLRRQEVVSGIATFNTSNNWLKVPCRGGGFFVGITAPKTAEFQESIAIGIKLDRLNILTESLVESGLRILVTNFVHFHSIRASRHERMENEKQLALGQLASQVAHDIRSPLTALTVAMDAVSALPEKQRVLIRGAVTRIHDIANGLLDRNRAALVNSDKQTIHLIPGLIDGLLTEKRTQYRPRIGVELSSDLGESSYGLFAKVCPTEFKRALSNIIDNAVEAIECHGHVLIAVSSTPAVLTIRVTDNGIGIHKDIIPLLTAKGATYGKKNGSGLGLYYSRKILETWHGTLNIQSQFRKGTVVTVTLRRASPPAWFLSHLTLRSNHPVVVLDDDLSIHQVWKERFRATSDHPSIPTHNFTTTEQLAAWLSNKRPSATYLIDYELRTSPQNGLDAITDLHLEAHSILVTSRYEDTGILKRCLSLGIKVLPKAMAAIVPISISKEI